MAMRTPLYMLEGVDLQEKIAAEMTQRFASTLRERFGGEAIRVPVTALAGLCGSFRGLGSDPSGMTDIFARTLPRKLAVKARDALQKAGAVKRQRRAVQETPRAAAEISPLAERAGPAAVEQALEKVEAAYTSEAVAPTLTVSEVVEAAQPEIERAAATAAAAVTHARNRIQYSPGPVSYGPREPPESDDPDYDEVPEGVPEWEPSDLSAELESPGALPEEQFEVEADETYEPPPDYSGEDVRVDAEEAAMFGLGDDYDEYQQDETGDAFVTDEENDWSFGEGIVAQAAPTPRNVARVATEAVREAVATLNATGSAKALDETLVSLNVKPPQGGLAGLGAVARNAGEAAYVQVISALERKGMIKVRSGRPVAVVMRPAQVREVVAAGEAARYAALARRRQLVEARRR